MRILAADPEPGGKVFSRAEQALEHSAAALDEAEPAVLPGGHHGSEAGCPGRASPRQAAVSLVPNVCLPLISLHAWPKPDAALLGS